MHDVSISKSLSRRNLGAIQGLGALGVDEWSLVDVVGIAACRGTSPGVALPAELRPTWEVRLESLQMCVE